VFLAGVPVRTDLVRELARTVDDPELATKLQTAVVRDVKIIALDFAERDRILEALADECHDDLAEAPRRPAQRARMAPPRRTRVARAS
jgi:hypothetical protein